MGHYRLKNTHTICYSPSIQPTYINDSLIRIVVSIRVELIKHAMRSYVNLYRPVDYAAVCGRMLCNYCGYYNDLLSGNVIHRSSHGFPDSPLHRTQKTLPSIFFNTDFTDI